MRDSEGDEKDSVIGVGYFPIFVVDDCKDNEFQEDLNSRYQQYYVVKLLEDALNAALNFPLLHHHQHCSDNDDHLSKEGGGAFLVNLKQLGAHPPFESNSYQYY